MTGLHYMEMVIDVILRHETASPRRSSVSLSHRWRGVEQDLSSTRHTWGLLLQKQPFNKRANLTWKNKWINLLTWVWDTKQMFCGKEYAMEPARDSPLDIKLT